MITGGQIQTKNAFLYGKFETLMKPAWGSGVVSSFFTFNDVDFQNNWNEIDFEFLGRNTNQVDTNVIVRIGGTIQKNAFVQKHLQSKRSSTAYWKLCIDWTPQEITWSINNQVIRILTDVSLDKPQKLMMNIWNGNPQWAGEFNKDVIPQRSIYQWVRYSPYKDGKFVTGWTDQFNTLDLNRWYIALHNTGLTQLAKENVQIVNGNLILSLT